MENHQVRLLLHAGDVEGAHQLLDQRYARLCDQVGSQSLARRGPLLQDALLLIDEGQYPLAEERARAGLELWRQSAGTDPSWVLAKAKSVLGRCLAGQGQDQEVEDLLLEGYAGLEPNPIPAATQARWQVIDWIARFYETRSRPDEAAPWRPRSPWVVPPAIGEEE